MNHSSRLGRSQRGGVGTAVDGAAGVDPVIGAAVEQRAGDQALALKMVQSIELLEQLDDRGGGGGGR